MMTTQPITPLGTSIGWIGAGVMGGAMCGHLLTAGYGVTVHSRTRAKAQPLIDRGAHWAESPHETAARSEVLFTMVGLPQDVPADLFRSGRRLRGRPSPNVPHRHDDDHTFIEP